MNEQTSFVNRFPFSRYIYSVLSLYVCIFLDTIIISNTRSNVDKYSVCHFDSYKYLLTHFLLFLSDTFMNISNGEQSSYKTEIMYSSPTGKHLYKFCWMPYPTCDTYKSIPFNSTFISYVKVILYLWYQTGRICEFVIRRRATFTRHILIFYAPLYRMWEKFSEYNPIELIHKPYYVLLGNLVNQEKEKITNTVEKLQFSIRYYETGF